MRYVTAYNEDRAFPVSEIKEIYEEPVKGSKYVRLMVKLRSGEAVRIIGYSVAGVTNKLQGIFRPTGLWSMCVVYEQGA